MMADLGLSRRDLVSAPEDGGFRRSDPRKQQDVVKEFEARRTRLQRTDSAADEQVQRLRAWNSKQIAVSLHLSCSHSTNMHAAETTFERDSITDQLENRFSGQGHRAALSTAREYDRKWEEAEARFGEERRLHLQQRYGNNYVATPSPPRSGQDRFRSSPSGSTPRSFSGGHGGQGGNRNFERGRVVSGPSNPNRAPSPRASGTVRFAPGGRRVEPRTSGARTAALPPSVPAVTRLPTAGMRVSTVASAFHTLPTPAARASMPPAPAQAPRPPSVVSTASTRTAPADETAANSHTLDERMRFKMRAEGFVANLEEKVEREAYYRAHPDRVKYYEQAKKSLLKDAFRLVKQSDAASTSEYLSAHKDREWMFTAALKAKELVQNANDAESNAYYAAHPEHIDFIKPAIFYFRDRQGTAATPTPASTSQLPTTTASITSIPATATTSTPTSAPPPTRTLPTNAVTITPTQTTAKSSTPTSTLAPTNQLPTITASSTSTPSTATTLLAAAAPPPTSAVPTDTVTITQSPTTVAIAAPARTRSSAAAAFAVQTLTSTGLLTARSRPSAASAPTTTATSAPVRARSSAAAALAAQTLTNTGLLTARSQPSTAADPLTAGTSAPARARSTAATALAAQASASIVPLTVRSQPSTASAPTSAAASLPVSAPSTDASVATAQAPTTTMAPVATSQSSAAPAQEFQQQDPSSSRNSLDSANSVETAASEPAPSALGSLSATFLDITGRILAVKTNPVNVPAHININVTSRARRYDPRNLVLDIEALANMMQERSNGVGRSSTGAPQGARLTDDGPWQIL